MLKFLKGILFQPGPKYSWKKAAIICCLSSIIFSGGAFFGVFFYAHFKKLQPSLPITAILQTSPGFQDLNALCLAELLELSVDQPTTLNQISLEEKEQSLLKIGLFQDAKLKKIQPDHIFVQYQLRKPFAVLSDYTNTAFDLEGSCFPLEPFFLPTHLLEVYLGDLAPKEPWGKKISPHLMELICALSEKIGAKNLLKIDLSQIEKETAGKREIVVSLKNGTLLRLHPKNYVQQLAHYSILAAEFLEGKPPMIVDLRLPEVAYLKT